LENWTEMNLGNKMWCVAPNLLKVFKPTVKADAKTAEEIKSIINKSNIVMVN